jgi:hypothetical protein
VICLWRPAGTTCGRTTSTLWSRLQVLGNSPLLCIQRATSGFRVTPYSVSRRVLLWSAFLLVSSLLIDSSTTELEGCRRRRRSQKVQLSKTWEVQVASIRYRSRNRRGIRACEGTTCPVKCFVTEVKMFFCIQRLQ